MSRISKVNAIVKVLNRGGRMQRNFSKLQFKPLTGEMRKRLLADREALIKAGGKMDTISFAKDHKGNKTHVREPRRNPNRTNGTRSRQSIRSNRMARKR